MTTATRCPRCGGAVRISTEVDGYEETCLTCGWRGEATKREMRSVTTADPFDQLVDACKVALGYIAERADKATAEAAARNEQRTRVVKAMEALTGTKAKGKAPTAIRVCEDCGNHRNSKAHKEGCKAA